MDSNPESGPQGEIRGNKELRASNASALHTRQNPAASTPTKDVLRRFNRDAERLAMVDQLGSFASEVTRVTREVGGERRRAFSIGCGIRGEKTKESRPIYDANYEVWRSAARERLESRQEFPRDFAV